jgi:hypothetical protein
MGTVEQQASCTQPVSPPRPPPNQLLGMPGKVSSKRGHTILTAPAIVGVVHWTPKCPSESWSGRPRCASTGSCCTCRRGLPSHWRPARRHRPWSPGLHAGCHGHLEASKQQKAAVVAVKLDPQQGTESHLWVSYALPDAAYMTDGRDTATTSKRGLH